MNAETFCEHFATFADAPNGIAKLRDLIRTLAVRGKLVAQDRKDEPAVAIVEKIEAEKLKLSETGDVKSDKKTWVSSLVNPPYDIPSSWCWVRLQDVFEISRGGSPRPAGDPRFFGGSIPWITVGEVTKDSGKYLTGTTGGLTEEGSARSRFINPGDLLLTNSGATLGVPKISKIRGCMNDGVAVLRQFHQVDLNEFAYLYLTQQTSAFRSVNQGMGQPNLNTPIIAGWFLPFPPLAEQRRIVEKVDQLLGLCDELAARQAAQREKRQRLVGATLDRLVSTRNPAEFPTHAHRLRNHFDQLFDTPTTIPQLRQAILQLAVQGQLVPQDPNDEPASILLERARMERIGASDDDDAIDEKMASTHVSEDLQLEQPASWKLVRFAEVISYGPRNGISPKPVQHVSKTKSLTLSATTSGAFDGRHVKYLDEEFPPDSFLWLQDGDILIQRSNSEHYVGIAAIYRGKPNDFVYPDLMMKVRVASCIDVDFAHLILMSPSSRGYFRNRATGTSGSMRKINKTTVKMLPIPLPPLAEQKRIVTKVTELLSLCDALEAKLTQAESASTQLLSAAVHHLLNGAATNV